MHEFMTSPRPRTSPPRTAKSQGNGAQGNCPAVIVAEVTSPTRIIAPASGRISPVVVSSPHSGRQYPRRFMDQSILPLTDLRKVEDAGVDQLLTFQPLPAPILLAEFPRSFVDVNRDYGELDPDMFDGPVADTNPVVSRYLRSGLGMIPRKASGRQDIYANTLPSDEAAFRRTHFYTPYHDALKQLLKTAHARGPALLLDCHSMPSGIFGVDADIIIGTNHGTSADIDIVHEAINYFSREGLVVKLNAPFSGGYVTRHYGQPHTGISALQIEICRSRYLNETRIELKNDWQALAAILTRFVMRMDEFMLRRID